MRTFTKDEVAVGLAWLKTQPQDKYGGGPDGFPDTTCTQGGYEQVAGFIATALADGRKQGLEEAAKVVERETENTEWADLAKEIRALKEEA